MLQLNSTCSIKFKWDDLKNFFNNQGPLAKTQLVIGWAGKDGKVKFIFQAVEIVALLLKQVMMLLQVQSVALISFTWFNLNQTIMILFLRI